MFALRRWWWTVKNGVVVLLVMLGKQRQNKSGRHSENQNTNWSPAGHQFLITAKLFYPITRIGTAESSLQLWRRRLAPGETACRRPPPDIFMPGPRKPVF